MSRRSARAAALRAVSETSGGLSSPSPAPVPPAKRGAKRTTVTTVVTPTNSAASTSLPIQLFASSQAWETWLSTNHHATPLGLWVKISKKASGIPSVSYDEAIDVALCYGWIDGQRKSHDDQHFIQRFTPRRKNSLWSKRNVDKVAALIREGRMRPAGQTEIDAAKVDGRWDRAYASPSNMTVPADFAAALSANKKAQRLFDALSKSQRYSFLWRIETTKRAETRTRKITEFVDMLAEGKTL